MRKNTVIFNEILRNFMFKIKVFVFALSKPKPHIGLNIYFVQPTYEMYTISMKCTDKRRLSRRVYRHIITHILFSA